MIPPISLDDALPFLIRVFLAYALALPIGWNREAHDHSAGLRTFPLVSAGACGFMLLGLSVLHAEGPRARVLYGIVTGIGFIGGGAILKLGGTVTGTATAASIWNMGAVGVAVAWGRVDLAFLLCLVNALTLWLLKPMLLGRRPGSSETEAETKSGADQL
ncbi:MAG: MgtC/SapB family protein [Planctomycetota bacterium]